MQNEGSSVAVGIDADVVANHHVVICRPVAGGSGEIADDFVVSPTLSGMATLSKWTIRQRSGATIPLRAPHMVL